MSTSQNSDSCSCGVLGPLCLADPAPEWLTRTADLLGDREDGGPLGAILLDMLEHHLDHPRLYGERQQEGAMAKRHELTNGAWALIAPLLPAKSKAHP